MSRTLTIWVPGVPVPQGSMNPGRRGKMFHKPELIAWRDRVLIYAFNAAQRQGWVDNYDGLVEAAYTFVLPKPKQSKFKWWPGTKPDLDKLIRAINDALSPVSPRRILSEDSRIIRYVAAEKQYALSENQPTGVRVVLRQVEDSAGGQE